MESPEPTVAIDGEDAESARERILAAATAELAEYGYAGMRMDNIAAIANCNKQLMYYYFKSKAGLRTAVLERMARMAVPYWNRVEGKTVQEASDLSLERLKDTPETRSWRRLLAWEGLEEHDEPIVLEDLRTQAWSKMADVFRQAQARGELDPDIDPGVTALVFVLGGLASDTMPQLTKMISGYEATDPEFFAKLRVVLRRLADGLRPAT